ncbi:alpha/beta-hydrolase [Saccharata proteae CBS 121410]|uniref:Carboxypeptidase n=1 Tax=Saccharata proteae CBS 121410 TaxID=1314787 RepID=A0A9P4HZ15_9PEZI|nr:alpha/beta-hydrolase [Saccharata proteae CBS 121410]
MRVATWLSFCALAAGALARRSPQHVGKKLPDGFPRPRRGDAMPKAQPVEPVKRSSEYLVPQNNKTIPFTVNGTALPDVDFDIGESYAGLLPINDKTDGRSLYFWYFPSSNPDATDEITIWLNGGPGCSSLEGFFQENGPVLWQYGTFKPVQNPWTWVNLTNMVWVEQPVGTGFSQGAPTATNEEEVAKQFLGFFKNFVDTFSLHGKKVYIAGESYAGYYVPYIADAMFNKNDTTYYNVEGTMIYDPSTSYDVIQEEIPAVAFVDHWAGLFNLNDTFMADIHTRADECGYTDFMNDYLVYPPKGPLPTPPEITAGCDLWDDIYYAAILTNPCMDMYQVATTCPVLWDVLGFPGSFEYIPEGASIYFNRSDVQAAINAPIQEWSECADGVLLIDTSKPSGLSVLPGVIERSKRTVIGHGLLDYILIANGTRLMIQNMTWNGAQGFQEEPSDPFFVPYHADVSDATLAASGYMGTTHTERGLTYVEVALSGHMIPQYQPSASYRHLEFLLGRIDSLTEQSDFTTQSGDYGNGFDFKSGNLSMSKRQMGF